MFCLSCSFNWATTRGRSPWPPRRAAPGSAAGTSDAAIWKRRGLARPQPRSRRAVSPCTAPSRRSRCRSRRRGSTCRDSTSPAASSAARIAPSSVRRTSKSNCAVTFCRSCSLSCATSTRPVVLATASRSAWYAAGTSVDRDLQRRRFARGDVGEVVELHAGTPCRRASASRRWASVPPSVCCTRSISSRATRPSCRSRSRIGPAASAATSKLQRRVELPGGELLQLRLGDRGPSPRRPRPAPADTPCRRPRPRRRPAPARSRSTPAAARISFSVSVIGQRAERGEVRVVPDFAFEFLDLRAPDAEFLLGLEELLDLALALLDDLDSLDTL